MFEKFLSTIGIGSMKVDTIVEKSHILYGETLSGQIFIDCGRSEQQIDYINLEVIKRMEGYREDSDFDVTNDSIAKHTIEVVGDIKLKETRIIPFELKTDEAWDIGREDAKLFLRTSVHITNAVDVHDEDEIFFSRI